MKRRVDLASSSPRITWRRPTGCVTGSRSSMAAGSSTPARRAS
jgi:hypothetical protein